MADDAAVPAWDAKTFKKGLKTFKRKQCSGCHAIDTDGQGEKGPGLKGIYAARGREWITNWLKNAETLQQTDPEMKKMLETYPDGMPDPELSDEQLEAILYYLAYDGVAKE
ncbi:MAG: cytochrome c [Chrysiogenetes bacterium]|nr:cytochrome c [Chrysiogenetes bacterium]